MYPIQRSVPCPVQSPVRRQEILDTFFDMKEGDSFVYPAHVHEVVKEVAKCNSIQIHYRIEEAEDRPCGGATSYRVWRIA